MNYDNPCWNTIMRVHDWRNYINRDLQEIWHTFSPEQQRVIGENAQELADREEWE